MANLRKLLSIESQTAIKSAVADCLQQYVTTSDRIVVGLSGGVDSVVLLHILTEMVELERLSAVHVNHGLSLNSDKWSEFCISLCRRIGVSCTSTRVEVERDSSDGLEGAARRARHGVFASQKACWIALAHHQDDKAETLMFNLLRGCGVSGAASMRERNGSLLRPLLAIGRAEIVTYAKACGLEWCDDESNSDEQYSRNYLRRKIFPELRGRFPAATANMAQAGERFAEANELLDTLASIDLGAHATGFPVSLELLANLTEPRARNALRYLLTCAQVQIPSERRLREALRQMLVSGPDKHPVVMLGHSRLLRKKKMIYLELVDASS